MAMIILPLLEGNLSLAFENYHSKHGSIINGLSAITISPFSLRLIGSVEKEISPVMLFHTADRRKGDASRLRRP
jgi:hypothetical protein